MVSSLSIRKTYLHKKWGVMLLLNLEICYLCPEPVPNNAPNLPNSVTENGYNTISTRIKWDDSVENVTLTQTWGAEFIHFNNAKKILSKIKTASSMLLELDWYGEGHVYFKFPLNGASEAIAEILKCE